MLLLFAVVDSDKREWIATRNDFLDTGGRQFSEHGQSWYKVSILRDINYKRSQSNLGRAASPPLTAENNYAKVLIGYSGMPNICPQNYPFFFDDLYSI